MTTTPSDVLARLASGNYRHTDAQHISGEGGRRGFHLAARESGNGRDQLAPGMAPQYRGKPAGKSA